MLGGDGALGELGSEGTLGAEGIPGAAGTPPGAERGALDGAPCESGVDAGALVASLAVPVTCAHNESVVGVKRPPGASWNVRSRSDLRTTLWFESRTTTCSATRSTRS